MICADAGGDGEGRDEGPGEVKRLAAEITGRKQTGPREMIVIQYTGMR